MDAESIIEYLKTWVDINRQGVYGSAEIFVDGERLQDELSRIKHAMNKGA